MITAADIAGALDQLLRTRDIPDYGNALNGLQVESDAPVTRVAAAVDARLSTLQGAIDAGAQLLLVHHGLFWGGVQPLRGAHRRRIELLLSGRLALYSSHLPLDAHPTLGNNTLLAHELGLVPTGGFARHESVEIGVMGETQTPTAALIDRAEAFARVWGGSARHTAVSADQITRRWAICTGAGASADTMREAIERGIDTMIVGEGPHWTAVDAEELGLTIVYAGHYATETLGVRALAEHVSREFAIPWTFVHAPTGL